MPHIAFQCRVKGQNTSLIWHVEKYTIFFYKRRLIFSSTGHLLFLPIFPVLMSLMCLLFFRWWHSSLVKIYADIRGKNRKKISVSVLSKCDPIWFHYYVVVHDFLQQKVRLSGSSLTSKNFSTEHLLFLPKFPVLNILSLINVSLIKKKSCTTTLIVEN